MLQGLRARQQTLPVLIITARDAVSDRVQGGYRLEDLRLTLCAPAKVSGNRLRKRI